MVALGEKITANAELSGPALLHPLRRLPGEWTGSEPLRLPRVRFTGDRVPGRSLPTTCANRRVVSRVSGHAQ